MKILEQLPRGEGAVAWRQLKREDGYLEAGMQARLVVRSGTSGLKMLSIMLLWAGGTQV